MSELHRRTFDFFWETTPPESGLAPDNWPAPDFCSIAAVGFALTAYAIGAHEGYTPRATAAGRALATLRTFWDGRQGPSPDGVMGHKGFFYHFLDMRSGLRHAQVELSSVDTALFLAGALTCGAYFDGAGADEVEIRKLAVSLYERVDWTFMERPGGLISMGWRPEANYPDHDGAGLIKRSWDRYNEGMLIYLLALASPTHPISDDAWRTWTNSLQGGWTANYDEPHLGFAPLFGHQYSHIWYDFRGVADAYMRSRRIDYFINSRRATLAQRKYAIDNPFRYRHYGADVWGLTACRGPANIVADVDGRRIRFHEYAARGPITGDGEGVDDGTIAPTAAISSAPFAPEICLPLIRTLRARYGDDLYDRYGFRDAFNPSFPASAPSRAGRMTASAVWVANEYLGIDQGPILAMLENLRSGFVWDRFCRSPLTGPIVRRGFRAAGFQPVSASGRWLDR